ncbi:MAG: gliding motility-associated C-terminal domain-containing protein [Saprospiraceae bacterium]|nr:gliding motility-associated C-terminal domain-containing protein [Saprospiraceae bacterium]MBK9223076.1 gliding motility-associated C-terminal domain-containing protein [Saprospiraceae bacterium]MBK9727595.1 gliding motility-associated C-terminal domain-containing protein [Saprospiraceae bacterium]
MQKIFLLIGYFAFVTVGFSQNLIPNPGFEQCDKCDSRGFFELGIGYGANDPIDWNASTYGTPDIYSISPRTGKKHGGFFLGFPKYEYLTNHFTSPLKAGATYRFSFWVRPGTQNLNYILDEIGVYIQTGTAKYPQADPLKQLIPTFQSPNNEFIDASGYRQYSFEYLSCGGEDHFIVGRFQALQKGDTMFVGAKRPANPASEPIYYFVDDFEMIELNPPVAIDLLPEKIALCPGEIKQISISAPYDKGAILWSTGETNATINIPQSSSLSVEIKLNDFCKTVLRDTILIQLEKEISIKILGKDSICIGDTVSLNAICNGNCFDIIWNTNETTKAINITKDGVYTVKAKSICKELTDSKEVFSLRKLLESFIQFPNLIIPNGEEVNREFRPIIDSNHKDKDRIKAMKMVIYNRWGQKLFETSNKDGKWIPEINTPMETYMYVVEFEYQDCDQIRKRLMKGSVTLVR